MNQLNVDGLWSGRMAQVQIGSRGTTTGPEYEVMVMRRMYVATFHNRDWANAFAEVIESFIPESSGLGLEDSLRLAHHGMLGLAGTKHLVAGVLARAAELQRARSLEALTEPEREHHRRVAATLENEAKVLGGGR